jgi:hypothetical protein
VIRKTDTRYEASTELRAAINEIQKKVARITASVDADECVSLAHVQFETGVRDDFLTVKGKGQGF